MLPTNSLLQLALCLSAFGSLVAASPAHDPRHAGLVVRQDDASTTDSDKVIEPTGKEESGTADPEPSRTTDGPRKTDDGGDSRNTAKPDETDGTRSGSGSKTKSGSPKHTIFPPDLPPGGVEMLTPTALPGSTPLYKIGEEIEWGWNYTSLSGTPTAIDVIASCAKASTTWVLGSNITFETSANFTWDTSEQENDNENPLLTELYTLIIKDAEAEMSDTPEAGYLGVYSQFTFGLYARQPYTPMADWKCVACNSAPTLGGQAIGLALMMSLISVLSFTWFVTGLGLH